MVLPGNDKLRDRREENILQAPPALQRLHKTLQHPRASLGATETPGIPPALLLLTAAPKVVQLFCPSSSSSPQRFSSALLHSVLSSELITGSMRTTSFSFASTTEKWLQACFIFYRLWQCSCSNMLLSAGCKSCPNTR